MQCVKRPIVVVNKLNWANALGGQCVKQAICNAFISCFAMPFTFTYVPRTTTGYTVYIYVNRWTHSYSLKHIYPCLALSKLLFFLYALGLFGLHISIPTEYLNQDTEDLLHPLMNTFLPLYYNQLWTSLPNTSQYVFGLPLVNIYNYKKRFVKESLNKSINFDLWVFH